MLDATLIEGKALAQGGGKINLTNDMNLTMDKEHNQVLQDTKISFCFLNRERKTHLFLGVTVKNDFNMRISFLLKQFCCCCFDTRLVFLI